MKALQGVRVLELGQLIAGPFAGSMLASFGAEVINGRSLRSAGDPMRSWRMMHQGTRFWWYGIAQQCPSRSTSCKPTRHRALRELIGKCDIVIENFRPGRMEEWGLGYEELSARQHRALIMVRVSGWGQTGPMCRSPRLREACRGHRRPAVSDRGTRSSTRAHRASASETPSRRCTPRSAPHRAPLSRAHRARGRWLDMRRSTRACSTCWRACSRSVDFFGKVRERSGAKLAGIVPEQHLPLQGTVST